MATYLKNYTKEHIRLTGRRDGDRVHLVLSFNFGCKVGGKYVTLRVATGHAVDHSHWDMDQMDFRLTAPKPQKMSIMASCADLREQVWTAYTALTKEIGGKPTPDQVLARMKGDEMLATPVTLADWIREIVQDPTFVKTERTGKKYLTAAAFLDAVQLVRDAKVLPGFIQGKGPIMLSMTDVDWSDLAMMMQRAASPISKTINYRGGVEAIQWIKNDEASFYSVNTLEKLQQGVKAALHHAVRKGRVKIDTSRFGKATPKKATQEFLTADEIDCVIASETMSGEKITLPPYLDNVRRLFVCELMLGVAVSDMEEILTKPVRWISGERIDFAAIYHVRDKTQTKMTIPVFRPAMDLLEGTTPRPYMICEVDYNKWLKEVCQRLGLDRVFHLVEPKANGKSVESEVPLCTMVSSHTSRRSLKELLERTCRVARPLVCQMMGHSLHADKGADQAYLSGSNDKMAEQLVEQVMDIEHRLPFDLTVTRQREERKRRRA